MPLDLLTTEQECPEFLPRVRHTFRWQIQSTIQPNGGLIGPRVPVPPQIEEGLCTL